MLHCEKKTISRWWFYIYVQDRVMSQNLQTRYSEWSGWLLLLMWALRDSESQEGYMRQRKVQCNPRPIHSTLLVGYSNCLQTPAPGPLLFRCHTLASKSQPDAQTTWLFSEEHQGKTEPTVGDIFGNRCSSQLAALTSWHRTSGLKQHMHIQQSYRSEFPASVSLEVIRVLEMILCDPAV